MIDLYEELAAIEHERWADWQRHVFNRCSIGEGGYLIDKNDVKRWTRQIRTPYTALSEKEKQKDRDQVDRYWPLIKPLLERADG